MILLFSNKLYPGVFVLKAVATSTGCQTVSPFPLGLGPLSLRIFIAIYDLLKFCLYSNIHVSEPETFV